MADIVANLPALRTMIDEEHRARASVSHKHASEENTVARLMAERADPKFWDTPVEELLVENYWRDEFEHMRMESWWDDLSLYASFMYLLWLHRYCIPKDWQKNMVERGKKLLQKEGR